MTRSGGVPRPLYWVVTLVCLGAVVWGGVIAWSGYQATSGPDGAVKGYFAALGRGDSAAALGFGLIPDGAHTLLTAKVLAEQRRLAPISDVTVLSTSKQGASATVVVRYRLGFASGTRTATDRIRVVRHSGSWRLEKAAVLTHLDLTGAYERASILGAGIPDGDVLMFPGAVPITFDTPYLQLAPSTSSVRLSDSSETLLSLVVTPAGRQAVLSALTTAITGCVAPAAHPDPRCPLPSDRVVPGSVRGRLSANSLAHVRLAVSADGAGVIGISGSDVAVNARYTSLDFNNQRISRTGPVALSIDATTFAVAPIRIDWRNT